MLRLIHGRFTRKFSDESEFGFDSISDNEGKDGVLFIARTIGHKLLNDPDYWLNDWIPTYWSEAGYNFEWRKYLEQHLAEPEISAFLHACNKIAQTQKRPRESFSVPNRTLLDQMLQNGIYQRIIRLQLSYQQTVIDTYSKVAFAKLYDRKNALVAADMLNDRVIPFFDSKKIPVLRVLTDRGSEYCGNREHHEYELYLDLENIDHTKTKAKSPQTNGICERFHKTILSEFYQIAFRKKIYESIEMLQNDLDEWLREYNESRPHSGKYCYGKTPMQTFLDSQPLAKEKMLQYSNNIPNQKEI